MAIFVEATSEGAEDLYREIEQEIKEFDKQRQQDRGCLPLTDYEKVLLHQFLDSLVE